MWRYLFRRDDDEPAPWTNKGKQRSRELGITMQVNKYCLCSMNVYIFTVSVAASDSTNQLFDCSETKCVCQNCESARYKEKLGNFQLHLGQYLDYGN